VICSDAGGDVKCVCRNHWQGDSCEVCPGNWDPNKGCNECKGSWAGSNCETCSGFGDRCQCPNNTYAPQPGTDYCWTCQLHESLSFLEATDGVCRSGNGADGKRLGWLEADAECKAIGFRLPTPDEAMGLLDNCSVNPNLSISCSQCVSSTTCKSMYYNSNWDEETIGTIWNSESCGADKYWRSSVRDGWARNPNACEDDNAISYMVCVKN
jgi:hypothetical protein